jgi:hypothetical protein
MVNPGWSKAKYAARDVHLDEDAAGRLLENMGDHIRREMIVRMLSQVRQNPAYRPIVDLKQPPMNVGGCLLSRHTLKRS